jgi:hypothetical protein
MVGRGRGILAAREEADVIVVRADGDVLAAQYRVAARNDRDDVRAAGHGLIVVHDVRAHAGAGVARDEHRHWLAEDPLDGRWCYLKGRGRSGCARVREDDLAGGPTSGSAAAPGPLTACLIDIGIDGRDACRPGEPRNRVQ